MGSVMDLKLPLNYPAFCQIAVSSFLEEQYLLLDVVIDGP